MTANSGALSSGRHAAVNDSGVELTFDAPANDDSEAELTFDAPVNDDSEAELTFDAPVNDDSDALLTFDAPANDDSDAELATDASSPDDSEAELTTDARSPDDSEAELEAAARRAGDCGALLIKNPSPTASLHLWLRIFPGLKVLIALRDPRDVIISCFFQKQMLSATNANFLGLERTAKHYADLMDVWLRLRDLGGFDWMESRYEDIVKNLEAEGRRVTEFLGLAWHERQANFHEAARQKFVFAPTCNEVTRPVHTRAVNRWQHYAEALAPIEQRLSPYCRALGYS
jgi:hypothetical protein